MFTEKYTTDIEPILKDWLVFHSKGKSISNYPLSLANRAQKKIWLMREWQRLFSDVALTLTNNVAALPSDFGREVIVGSDLGSSGKIDFFYKREGETGQGYKIEDSFTKAGGHSYAMTFFNPLYSSTTIYLRHIKKIDDFVGTGVEYSYFPADLIILQAQIIFISMKEGIKEYQLYKKEFDLMFWDYCNSVQHCNTDLSFKLIDKNGNMVVVPSCGLDGEGSEVRSRMPNSYIEFSP
jgi:hypothetical protein